MCWQKQIFVVDTRQRVISGKIRICAVDRFSIKNIIESRAENQSDSEKQDVVALLFLSVSRNGFDDTFGDLEDDFRRSLFTELTNS